jgi:dipeptidyl aminopeptidase/acylaminoacyl peptidase
MAVSNRKIALLLAYLALPLTAALAAPPPTGLTEALSYPFVGELVAAEHGDRIAWVSDVKGIRTLWAASGPDFRPSQVTRAADDDGLELTGLVFSPDGKRLAWVRGGDHDANWPAAGDLQPDPANGAEQVKLTVWSASADGPAVKIGDGDAPALSATGRLAYVNGGQAWAADAGDKGKPGLLFFDRGKIADLAWSPDGTRLAFVSRRGDHSFVGIYSGKSTPILWLAPSTGFDEAPVWSPDGTRIAFTRRPGEGGAPEPMLTEVPQPWSIWVADAKSGEGSAVWRSPNTLEGSYPAVEDGADLMWAAGGRLVFRAEMDGWPHLYSVPAAGGDALLLTPGAYMVEHARLGQDRRSVLFDANVVAIAGDDDRRHVYTVPVDQAAPVPLTHGSGLEWTPVSAGRRIAWIAATPLRPAAVAIADAIGAGARPVASAAPAYSAPLVVPQQVTFKAADGLLIHGQLFATPGGAAKKPAVIFVHGGPPRQMLLGWSYMDYYSHAYAMNQYLASRGFVVLSVNYRLGIGYGRAFQHPAKAGPAGASEYQDVVAGARFLQHQASVDPDRIGIWGGSYGGYLTALALARDSGIFKAGVDLHGVHDWSRLLSEEAEPAKRYEQGDWPQGLKTAFESSPVASISGWKSPVLLIHGDDDRNVRFNQTIDLARRLDAHGVTYEELVLPNEIHGFLRYSDWLKADTATVHFLEAELKP